MKRVAGLALPLALCGGALAVRAAAAGPAAAASAADCATTTTSGGLPTTLPITLPGSGSTTTTAATTTTASGSTTTTSQATTTTTCATTTTVASGCPTTTTSSAGTTTTVGTTTTAGGTTTTAGGLPTTLPIGGGSTTTTATTTCPTTTTAPSTPVVITSVASDHVAGHALIVDGTSESKARVVVSGTDPKRGKHALGSTTASSTGKWQLKLAHGVLYNTVLQATSGAEKSNKTSVGVHQVLNIKSDRLVGKSSKGYSYKLAGSSASHVPGELITVTLHGKTLGKGKMRSDGTFIVKFVVKNKTQKLTLKGSGKSGSGVEYTLPGKRTFHG